MRRVWSSVRGDGDYSVTVPPMDGALNPNRALDEAPVVASADAPDNLCEAEGRILFTSGDQILEIDGASARPLVSCDSLITSLAACEGALAIALADGTLRIRGGAHDGLVLKTAGDRALDCVTALAFEGPHALWICLGSQRHPVERWKYDLMQLGASGSVWRVDLRTREAEAIGLNLAFPFGVLPVEGGAIVAESWRHRLVLLRKGEPPKAVLSDLPAYPARIVASPRGGAWLALFAPRRQLTEFILREPTYRRRMMAEIPPDYWVGPTLAPMQSFLEPLQGGTLKKLAAIKPWAPSRSYGLVARLDADWQPVLSLHSRADGSRHGVMSAIEARGRIYAASRGASAVVAVELTGDE
jgi:hypothetical protein